MSSTSAIDERSAAGHGGRRFLARGPASAELHQASCSGCEFDDVDGEGVALDESELGDAADGPQVALREPQRRQRLGAAPSRSRVSTGVFCDALASVFARRMPMSAALAAASTAGSPLDAERRGPRGGVHRALVEPRPRLLGGERRAPGRAGAAASTSAMRSARAAEAWPTSVRS